MKRFCKRILIALAPLAVLGGFFGHHEYAVFWWHTLPILGALVGALGALLLMVVIRWMASFAAKKEDFYD
jgi:hypothetical protein